MPQLDPTTSSKAVLRSYRMSAYKAREVLDLIRGKHVAAAMDILSQTERDAATVIAKILRSAAANAADKVGTPPEELFVSACWADEGATMKRIRPRARGRAGRILKRTCHITVVVERLSSEQLARLRDRRQAEASSRRARRVKSSQPKSESISERAEAALEARSARVAEVSPEVVSQHETPTVLQATDEGVSLDASESATVVSEESFAPEVVADAEIAEVGDGQDAEGEQGKEK